MYETGTRVAEMMLQVLRGKVAPCMALAKRPLIVSPSKARTVEEPLQSIVAAARKMEADGEILHASFFPVQPWLDLPGLGFAVLVCTDGNAAAAQRAADRLADLVWAGATTSIPNSSACGKRSTRVCVRKARPSSRTPGCAERRFSS